VVDWFGTWGPKALSEVGKEFTMRLDMGDAESVGGSWGIGAGQELMSRVEEAFEGSSQGLHQAVVAALVELHTITKKVSEEEASSASSISRTFLSPR
jgi:dynein heavy chain 1